MGIGCGPLPACKILNVNRTDPMAFTVVFRSDADSHAATVTAATPGDALRRIAAMRESGEHRSVIWPDAAIVAVYPADPCWMSAWGVYRPR